MPSYDKGDGELELIEVQVGDNINVYDKQKFKIDSSIYD